MLGRTALITMAFGTAAGAQELPATERLQTLVADKLPSYWTINDLSVVTTSREGDAAQPKAIMRFEATATAEGALFAATGEEGPFVLVSETYGAEEERTLYGFAKLSYSAGEWDGGVTIENPVTDLGQPSDYFTRPALVAGTEEAEQRLQALHSLNIGIAAGANAAELQRIERQHQAAVSELKARQTEALAELQTQHASELADAKSAAQQELAGVERKYEEKIASLKQSKEPKIAQLKAERAQALEKIRDDTTKAEIEARREEVAEQSELMKKVYAREKRLIKLKRQYKQQIANLKQSQEPKIAELRTKRKDKLRKVRSETDQAVQELKEQQRTKVEELKEQHAERRGEIIAEQKQELEKLSTGFSERKQSLKSRIAAAEEVIARQQNLTEKREKIASYRASLDEAIEQASENRNNNLSALLGVWQGTVDCGEGYDYVVEFTADELFGPGVRGPLKVNDNKGEDAQRQAVLSHETGIIKPPDKRLSLSVMGGSIKDSTYSFDLTMSENGRLSGPAEAGYSDCNRISLTRDVEGDGE